MFTADQLLSAMSWLLRACFNPMWNCLTPLVVCDRLFLVPEAMLLLCAHALCLRESRQSSPQQHSVLEISGETPATWTCEWCQKAGGWDLLLVPGNRDVSSASTAWAFWCRQSVACSSTTCRLRNTASDASLFLPHIKGRPWQS